MAIQKYDIREPGGRGMTKPVKVDELLGVLEALIGASPLSG